MPDPASPRPLSKRQQEMAERKEQGKNAPNGKEGCILEEATMPVLEEDYDSCAEYVFNDLLKRTGDEHLNVYHRASRFSGLLYLLPEAKMELSDLFKLTKTCHDRCNQIVRGRSGTSATCLRPISGRSV